MGSIRLGYEHEVFIANQVRSDRLHQLFRQSMFAVLGSFVAAGILSWLCWDAFNHRIIAAWLVLLSITTLLRTTLFVAYFRCPQPERTPQRWERRYWVTLLLSAGTWGGGEWALIPAHDPQSQLVVILFAVGMSVSAVSCYSAYRNMTLASIALVLLPCTLWLLVQPSTLQVGVAIAVLVFASFVAGATHKLSEALEAAFRLTREMEQAHNLSAHAAQTDELTGLKNRRAFYEQAQRLYQHCQVNRLPLCAVMLDMDHFKHINDWHGHQAGDQVLRQMGRVINETFRDSDICGRLGGEEFAIMLADTTLEAALEAAGRLCESMTRMHTEPVKGVTASLGIAAMRSGDSDLHHLMNNADKALYRAKADGRNQVVVFSV